MQNHFPLWSLLSLLFFLPIGGFSSPPQPPGPTRDVPPREKEKEEGKKPKLSQDLYRPDAAMVAALKLLEVPQGRGVLVLEEHFPKAPAEAQMQILRAIRFKKAPRALSLLFRSYRSNRYSSKVRRELAKTLLVFASSPKVHQYFLSLLQDPAVELSIRKEALETFGRLLERLPVKQALALADTLLRAPNCQRDYFLFRIFRMIENLSGLSFPHRKSWQEWWQKHQKQPEAWWNSLKQKSLEKRLSQQEERTLHWWKRYVDLLSASKKGDYIKALLTSVDNPPTQKCLAYSLKKIQDLIPLEKQARLQLVHSLLRLLERPTTSPEVRELAVVILGKVARTLPKKLFSQVEEALLRPFSQSLYLKLRIQACNALANLRAPKAREAFLRQLLVPRESSLLIQEILRNLGSFPETQDNQIVRTLLTYLKSLGERPDGELSEVLSLAMEQLGNLPYHHRELKERAIQLLEKFLSHPNMKIRYFAANSLGKVGNSNSLSALLKVLNTSNGAVQRAILASIALICQRTSNLPPQQKEQILEATLAFWTKKKFQKQLLSLYRQLLQGGDVAFGLLFLQKISQKGGDAKEKQELVAALSLLESLLAPREKATEAQKKLYRALVQTYLQHKLYPQALKLYQKFEPEPSLPKELYLKLLAQKVEVQEALKALEKWMVKQTNPSSSPSLEALLKLLSQKGGETWQTYLKQWQNHPALRKYPPLKPYFSKKQRSPQESQKQNRK